MSRDDFSRNYDKSRELCFDENEFLKESFSVDTFLREHRNKASLEIMRDDLGTHLKALRLSMIELINKDYEDFVNLSKDLVGLDSEIQNIQIPLEQIKEEIMIVKTELEDAITSFNACLEQHKEVTNKKRSIIYITQVISCMAKLKSIVDLTKGNPKDFNLESIERAMMEVNQLQFSVSKCKKDLHESQRQEAENIRQKLMNILNNKFIECLKKKCSKDIVKCLRIYAGLEEISSLESLVRNELIAPKFDKLITEDALQKEPDGVSHIYGEIIKFLETDLLELFRLTTWTNEPPLVKGYNFILNSIWPELERRLDLPLMFAPGNPRLFHSRFTKSLELVRKLELLCGNQNIVLQLRQHAQYQHFFQKWNLPVYFKIRFQEIAGELEKVLGEEITTLIHSIENQGAYYLRSSVAVIEQLKKCWADEIYLTELSHMFWKLSLQILSRYTVWITELLSKESEFLEKRKTELGTIQTISGMESFQIRSRLDFLVCLYSDTNKLVLDSQTFLGKCKEKMPNKEAIEEELSVSLRESLQGVEGSLPKITDSIVRVIVSESATHFRQVSQIPRLFRRTNRKSSTEPCEYVGQVLNLPRQFHARKRDSVAEDILRKWLNLIFNDLTAQFYEAVNEVLTNAKKTEESLRKLKKKKDNYSSKNSGDDEIRQQLVIDVHSFSDGVEGMQIQRGSVTMLRELVELVESARDKSEKQ